MRFPSMVLLVASAALLPSAASAQSASSNTITILQDGSGNTLTVDQSRARNSTVGGLSIGDPSAQTFTQTITTTDPGTPADPMTGTEAVAGSTTIETRTLTLDVLSATRAPAARQLGSGNQADVTIVGGPFGAGPLTPQAYVGLLQDSRGGLSGNTARVNLTGTGEALVGQIGGGNTATLSVARDALSGTILQRGNGNEATLNVLGSGASGLISQIGDGNQQSLTVVGAGTQASYQVQGVGTASTGPEGAVVISNGASVSITQTAFGAP